MRYCVIKIVGVADPTYNIQQFSGEIYVAQYDPDMAQYSDLWLTVTDRWDKAKRFYNMEDLHAFWTKQSTEHPEDTPGHANKPLTAFNIQIEAHETTEGERDGDPA
jgi:hypothetical protein